MHAHTSERLPGGLAALALLGAVLALAGGYWDDAWHTERGRDTFFIAPHLAIYGGVTLVGGALAAWVALSVRRDGARSTLTRPTLALAALSVGLTLASGPIDNAWHEAFGRDSVIWSPPHLLGIVGTLGLGAALLAEVARRRALALLAGGLVLAAATFTVVEYDTDVPQFDSVYYLPVLAVSAAVGLALVRLVVPGRWSAAAAAAVHLVFVGAVSLFLLAAGFEPPALPLLVLPAVLLDVGERQGWRATPRAALFTLAVFAVYVPARNWLGDGVEIDAADVLVGLAPAIAAVAVILRLASTKPRPAATRLRPVSATVALMLAVAVFAGSAATPPAQAHDPGQGSDAGSVDLTVRMTQGRAGVSGRWNSAACDAVTGATVVARRGGDAVRAPLAVDGCAFRGSVALPRRGRWFVYAELRTARGAVESWLPVQAPGAGRVTDATRYAYRPAARSGSGVKLVGGAVLYAVMLALLFATFRLSRNHARQQPSA